MILDVHKEKFIAAAKRDRATQGSGSDLNDFLLHMGQMFASAIGFPALLNEREILGNRKWAGKTENGNKIRRKIISVAMAALTEVTPKQQELWEGNAGEYTEEDLGLVDSRIGEYAAAVKVYAGKIKGQKVNAAGQIQDLYHIAATILLPELTKAGLFPKLDIAAYGEDCLFRRSEWLIRIDKPPVPLEVIDVLSASILHETRHIEQAWALCTVTPVKDLSTMKDVANSIKSLCKYPVTKGKQVVETAKRGERYHIKWDEIETLQLKLGLSLAEDAAIDSIDWAALATYFQKISWYYNHPREYDAYGSEQKYRVAYRKL